MGEDHYFPERGAVTPMPPTDPVLYRVSCPTSRNREEANAHPVLTGFTIQLYEAVLVYGYPIKQVIHEKFGDG